jgi:hypothetical protein
MTNEIEEQIKSIFGTPWSNDDNALYFDKEGKEVSEEEFYLLEDVNLVPVFTFDSKTKRTVFRWEENFK